MTNPNPWQSEENDELALDPRRDTTPDSSALRKNILRILKRYKWTAILLLTVLVPAAAAVGWKTGSTLYTSNASVHVKPVLPRIMFTSEEKGVPPMFDSLVNTQVELLKNHRVVDMAVQDPRWEKAYGKATALAVSQFIDQIAVRRKDEIVSVGVTNIDPAVAQAGVSSLIQAYKRLFVEQDSQEDEQRLSTLQQRRTTLTNEAATIRQQIQAIAERYGTEELGPLYDGRRKQVEELEMLKLKADIAATNPSSTTAPSEELELRAAAAVDPVMASLLKKRDDTQIEDSLLAGRMGPQSPVRAHLISDLAVLSDQVRSKYKELKENGSLSRAPDATMDPAARRKQIEDMLVPAQKEMMALGKQAMIVNGMRTEEKRLRDEIEQCRARIDELMLESATAGRLQILSEGDMPVEPSHDTRKRNAGAGLFLALVASFGAVMLRGFLDNQVRGLDDVPKMRAVAPMLGVLPEIPMGLDDQNLASQAAHNLHHIRTMLEIWAGHRSPLTLTVTSPSAGSGKTSLTLSLGVSFAAAGMRTLLIDLDLIGGGLTTRIDAMSHGILGSKLVSEGLITDEQRVTATKLAVDSGSRLGEACVRLGYATREQIDAVAGHIEHGERSEGVLEAIGGAPLEECVRDTGVKSMWVLSLGSAELEDAATVSPHKVRKLLNAAKQAYDIILVDTGPAPGSLEAGASAVCTDGVVVAVAVGESRAAIRSCCDYLTKAGATLAGLVFNRATPGDLRRYSTSRMSSSVYRSVPRLIGEAPKIKPGEATSSVAADLIPGKMGPIAGAVVTSVRSKQSKPANS